VIALGSKISIIDLDFVGNGVYSLQIVLGYNALNTLEIPGKFILCQKNIISIALVVFYTCL